MDVSNGHTSSSDWRSTVRVFLDKLKYILNHNIMADLTIRLVNDGIIDKEFNVHSFLFIIGSEVFEKMLISNFKEGVSRMIEIKDVDPEVFQMLINYLYGQHLDFENMKNLKKVRDLADIADYYMIHGLKDEIAKYFESVDTPQAACLGLTVAEKFNSPKLKDIKLQYIVSHTREIVKQEEFLSLPEQDISWILDQHILAINEIDLFKGIEAWIEANVVKYGKQIIDSLIPKVRYLSMTKEEFTLGPAKSNLIKPEVLLDLLCNLIVKDSMPFPSDFSRIKRNEIEFNFERVNLTSGSWIIFGIEVTKNIIIEGFYIFTLNGNPTESYDEVIEIKAGSDENDWSIVGRFKGKTNYSGSVFVQLDENLKISKGTIYWVKVSYRTMNCGASRVFLDLDKPLNVGDIKYPFIFIPHPNHLSVVMCTKLQAFET